MDVKYCYRCGREFRAYEEYHKVYTKHTDKLVPVCSDYRSCYQQRPDGASKEVIEYVKSY